ncbi:MAG: MBL fold metallo-hydrolase [Myxococcaceae bacterium]|nr:MBL fold metallo-hydrolase [Myxococcaceae bacterium]
MKLHRLDDYQSWLLEVGGRRIAIDPWLTHAHKLPPGHWLYGRRREVVPATRESIAGVDALLLTGPFADHCDPETLSVLPRDLPAYANRQAARRLRGMGFTRVTSMVDAQTATLFDGVTLEAVQPGFPYRHNSLGYVVRDAHARLYLETHMVDVARHGERVRDVDVAIWPVQGVWLLGIPFVMSTERAVEVTRELAPRVVVPTGNDPQRAHGLMSKAMLWCRGAVDDYAQLLAASGAATRFVPLGPGESL